MNILAAATSETVIEAALGYLECNISVVACMGKQTSVKWARWQVVRPTPGLIHWWHHKGFLQNVAIICGQVSQGLVCIDLDGMDAVREYEKKFHNYLRTFNVISGSGKGKHYYYRVKEVTTTTRTKGFELRSDGCYVVAPPSKHPETGNRYRVERYSDIMTLATIEDVRQWIIDKIPARQVEKKPSMGEVKQASAYAIAALTGECDNVRNAPVHERNKTLYRAALKLGNFVLNGSISRSEVEDGLMQAASLLSQEDGEGASWRTIQSGLNNSKANYQRRVN